MQFYIRFRNECEIFSDYDWQLNCHASISNRGKPKRLTLLKRVQDSEVTPDYKNVPPEELKERVYEIYRHLGDWLMTKDESELEARYLAIGARALQQVPLKQFAWAIVLPEETSGTSSSKRCDRTPVEVFGEMEMLEWMNQFFDRAIYYSIIGYELAVAERARSRK